MKKIFRGIFFVVLGVLVIGTGIFLIINQRQKSTVKNIITEYNKKKPTSYSTEIEPYVNFLETTAANVNPVDYVINLFDRYDIVVLCERDHREITQYELIYNIISDKRFIEKSGYVFTELGTRTINNRLDMFLKNDELKDQEIDEQLISLYRDLHWDSYWDKYNLYEFLKKVHNLNTSLEDNKDISINFTDMPIEWYNITHEQYLNEIKSKELSRDRMEVDFIIQKYRELEKGESPKKKILVIMNYRHAFKKQIGSLENTTAILNEELPGKVANIMINPVTNSKSVNRTIQNGKWDASFKYLNNENRAFDFRDSSFGDDYFDYYTSAKHSYTYKDVFDGFIFYNPLEKHKLVFGIPGYIDKEFLPTFKERQYIIDPSCKARIESIKYGEYNKEFNKKKEIMYPDLNKYIDDIEQWLNY